MSEIKIPGEAIETAHSSLGNVQNVLNDTAFGNLDFEQMLGGRSDVVDSANGFHSKWQDGHQQILDSIGDLKDQLQKVVDTFTDTDNQLGGSLDTKK